METKLILTIFQIIISILVIILIVLQGGGAGLSGSGSNYANYFASKRGFDKYFFYLTIILAITFVIISIATIFVI